METVVRKYAIAVMLLSLASTVAHAQNGGNPVAGKEYWNSQQTLAAIATVQMPKVLSAPTLRAAD